MMPLVSIIIPCFNAEKWVFETIQSAINQTWSNKEIIIVDDGSTDNSLDVLRKAESNGVKVIRQKNSGNGAARNTGFHASRGEFIQYLDADDLLAPNKVEVQMKRLMDANGAIASCCWGRFKQSVEGSIFRSEPVWQDLAPIEWLVRSWCGGGMMACHAWLIPRSVAIQAGEWNETICRNVDGEYFTRVILKSRQVLFCPEARVYYRSGEHSGSVSSNKTDRALTDTYRSHEMNVHRLLSVENSFRTRKAAATVFQHFIYQTYPSMLPLVRKAQFRVNELGGSEEKPGGTRLFKLVRRIVGWKLARRMEVSILRCSPSQPSK